MASRSLLSSLRSRTPSLGPSLLRHAHSHRLILDPKRDVVVNSQILNPLSPTAFSPTPPYAPLFPLYTPLSTMDPTAAPSSDLVPLPRDIFGIPLRKDLLHQCVVHHMTLLRRGTGHSLSRAEVRGSGRKLHAQKGSGRARVGDSGSGIRVGGGVVHGPKNRDWSTVLSRKVRQEGFKIALSQKMREGRVRVVDAQGLQLKNWLVPDNKASNTEGGEVKMIQAASKSALVNKRFKELGFEKALLLHSPWSIPPPNLLPRSTKNLTTASLQSISSISTLDVLKAHEIVFDLPALEWLIAKVRQFDELAYSAQFDGNAMVMRRRALGLSDFPKEGEEDESKALVRKLEATLGEGEGDMTSFEAEERAPLSVEEEAEVKRKADYLLRVLP